MNILGTRLAIGMGLMIGWSMGDGAPLSEDFPKKEIRHVTMGHKVRQLLGKMGKNQNELVKIGKKSGKITQVGV